MVRGRLGFPALIAALVQSANLTTDTFAANDNTPGATDALARRLYGVPVVVTNSATSGEALIGDFAGSARIFRTGSASITVHDSQPRDVAGTDYPTTGSTSFSCAPRCEPRLPCGGRPDSVESPRRASQRGPLCTSAAVPHSIRRSGCDWYSKRSA